MPSTATTGDTTVDEQFLDLVCNDQDLLAAEFDAIIAAEWPSTPAKTPRRGATGGNPSSGAARDATASDAGPAARPQQPGVGGWARQRSPPACNAYHHNPKGR